MARRDKYEIVGKLKDCHVPHAESFKSDNLNDIIAWAKQHHCFPLVMKSLASSGSFGVTICNSIEDIIGAFHQIMDQGNAFNEENKAVLIQAFLIGQEYIVNAPETLKDLLFSKTKSHHQVVWQ